MKKTSLSSTIIGSKNKIHQKEEANMSILSKILVTLVATRVTKIFDNIDIFASSF